MSEPEEFLAAVGAATVLGQGGDREGARRAFAGLWEQLGDDGDPLHRCAVAHNMADVQDDVREEISWDLRALDAAGQVGEHRAEQAGVPGPVAGLYPSLHLNLGEAYRKLGDLAAARNHLAQGLSASSALGDDGYGRMIVGALHGLEERLGAADGAFPSDPQPT